ncbi:hypothetical protein CRUP_008369, partial [Coryphaenoides rupestris]
VCAGWRGERGPVRPSVEGSYTSHWRLAHGGEQFGPRVWCSIVVDPLAPTAMMADGILVSPCVTPQGKNPLSKDGNGKPCAASGDQALPSGDQEETSCPLSFWTSTLCRSWRASPTTRLQT